MFVVVMGFCWGDVKLLGLEIDVFICCWIDVCDVGGVCFFIWVVFCNGNGCVWYCGFWIEFIVGLRWIVLFFSESIGVDFGFDGCIVFVVIYDVGGCWL